MSVFMKLLKRAFEIITVSGNIGRCPECYKIQFVNDVPELRILTAGIYKQLTWNCCKCKTEMSRENVQIPLSEFNSKNVNEDESVEIDEDTEE